MKYKLKRDLPFAKAGVPVMASRGNDLREGLQVYIAKAYVDKNFVDRATLEFSEQFDGKQFYIGGFDGLIKEGWIEEVKPREWWQVDTETGRFNTKQEADEWIKRSLTFPFKAVKVREVI